MFFYQNVTTKHTYLTACDWEVKVIDLREIVYHELHKHKHQQHNDSGDHGTC